MRTKTMILLMFFLSTICIAQTDRKGDREAIRAHIDAIFKAYINKDRETVKKTHSEDWRGFLTQSRTIIRGIDQYMAEADYGLKNTAGGMTAYNIVDYDISFHGNIAVINYIADIDWKQGDQTGKGKLRVLDIYEKRKGEWIQIASNVAQHPDIVQQQIEEARKSANH